MVSWGRKLPSSLTHQTIFKQQKSFQESEETCEQKAASLTVLDVVGVGRQAQGGGAVLALEAAAVEELALSTEPLHHIDPLAAEVTHVAASQVLGELLLERALGRNKDG